MPWQPARTLWNHFCPPTFDPNYIWGRHSPRRVRSPCRRLAATTCAQFTTGKVNPRYFVVPLVCTNDEQTTYSSSPVKPVAPAPRRTRELHKAQSLRPIPPASLPLTFALRMALEHRPRECPDESSSRRTSA